MNNKAQGLTYKASGVDIAKADHLIEAIKPIARRTHRAGILHGIGGFGAAFEIPTDRYKKPILVSGTDGVGTKLKLAIEMNQHDTIGIDLVAMCANDILSLGAEPLFFLDYFATGRLELAQAESIIKGIGKGCELAGTALIGGETAELPDMYHGEDYDLAGFCVGVVEKDQIIDGKSIKPGDTLLALASSGPHSNGYSLIRKVLSRGNFSLEDPFGDSSLGKTLITPTRIYVASVLQLLKTTPVKGIAHITGGGLVGNIPRILPEYTKAHIDVDSWTWPVIFQWLQDQGNVALEEMFRTFNLGIGMVLVVAKEHTSQAMHQLSEQGETVWQLGTIEASDSQEPQVILD